MIDKEYHIPALLEATIDGLNIIPDGVFIDVTFGGGGHSKAIYNLLSEKGKLISFDQDIEAKKNAWEANNFELIQSNFSFIKNYLYNKEIYQVDGVLADLGVSFHQFDSPERGFSIRSNEKLDMRMNQNSELTAYEIVNHYEYEDLKRVFKTLGELPQASKISQTIINKRLTKVISTTGELMDVLSNFAPPYKSHKFYAKVFQAIRMEVNNELENLKILLGQLSELIKPSGRLVIISYHSLEDRLVKNYLKSGNVNGILEKDFYGNINRPFIEVNRKPIIPDEDEVNINPRSRSAKLRIGERNGK